jgi:hypothetical protein
MKSGYGLAHGIAVYTLPSGTMGGISGNDVIVAPP